MNGGVQVKYMLLIAIGEGCDAEAVQFMHQPKSRGQHPAANPRLLKTVANGVGVRNGNALVTDGPFAEAREQLGG